MAKTVHDLFLSQMNDALAMENGLVGFLNQQAQNMPVSDISARLSLHAEQTRGHADVDRAIVQELGGNPTSGDASVQPPISPGMLGTVEKAISGNQLATLLKDGATGFSIENFELATYATLIAMAQDLGLTQIVPRLQFILQQEQEMAQFLADHTPQLVGYVIQQEQQKAA
jgi:ferritin-like metal-binding protein YciE